MRLTIATLIFAIMLTGCTPVIDARSRLLDISREGLVRVRQSIEARRQVAIAMEAAERKRLDAAFDADARRQSPLTDEWTIEARMAYAAAIDAFDARQRRAEQAVETDKANLAAIDAALQQLQSLDRSERKLIQIFGGLQ